LASNGFADVLCCSLQPDCEASFAHSTTPTFPVPPITRIFIGGSPVQQERVRAPLPVVRYLGAAVSPATGL